MANHGYITTHHKLTGDKLFDALTEISKARFGGQVKVEKGWDGWGPGGCGIIMWKDHAHPIWLGSSHKIEIRHGSMGDLDSWVEGCFINDLAFKFNGIITDDGICGVSWRGEKGKYPTLKAWLDKRYRIRKGGFTVPLRRLFIWNQIREAKTLRPDLKKFLT